MKINIASKEVIHFIGIGGIGMSGLAQIMKNMGFYIQGSDLNYNKNIEMLISKGIKVFIFHTYQEFNGQYLQPVSLHISLLDLNKVKCKIIKGSHRNIKITTPEDIYTAKTILDI